MYQPIVDLARGAVTGYELLTRFDGPLEAGPDQWFAAAERLGYAEELEAAVLSRTLAARAGLPPNCFASLNVSRTRCCRSRCAPPSLPPARWRRR